MVEPKVDKKKMVTATQSGAMRWESSDGESFQHTGVYGQGTIRFRLVTWRYFGGLTITFQGVERKLTVPGLRKALKTKWKEQERATRSVFQAAVDDYVNVLLARNNKR